ncbi:MAG: glycine--tRNA ligase [Nanoarchaeota archaeon]|nr:glycine--tRNA ligase [Nanoarchaeota archaeon]
MDIDEIAAYCKRRGLVYPTSEIYGNYSGFYDYGPVGVEVYNNIKQLWWKTFVQSREDVVGIDGSIITHPKVWVASGHVESFHDPLTECRNCKLKWRADHVVEDSLHKPTDGLTKEQLSELIIKNKIKCPKCKGDLGEVKNFNQMFITNVGPMEGETAFLRPETAQSIFADYKSVMDSTRLKPPFGIAQIGKSFRNEISPRNFLFRLREFEQAEIEYFVKSNEKNKCVYFEDFKNLKVNVLSEEKQKQKVNDSEEMTVNMCLKRKVFNTEWHAYWTAIFYKWYLNIGINPKNLRIRQHVSEELSHYSAGTVDIEYNYPMGWKELQGIADRTTYDLKQHQEHSKQNLEYFDEETKKKELLYVAAEPSVGMDRLFLTLIFDCLVQEKERMVLKINPKLAAYKCAIFPLVNKEGLDTKARELFKALSKDFTCFYDDSGSIGRRYRRQDEIGTPYCITIDFDTIKDDTVTIRDRDSMKQDRVKISNLKNTIMNKLT